MPVKNEEKLMSDRWVVRDRAIALANWCWPQWPGLPSVLQTASSSRNRRENVRRTTRTQRLILHSRGEKVARTRRLVRHRTTSSCRLCEPAWFRRWIGQCWSMCMTTVRVSLRCGWKHASGRATQTGMARQDARRRWRSLYAATGDECAHLVME